MKKHNEKWFIDRIKKEINRGEKTIKILDKEHAKYLFLFQNELGVFYTHRSVGV